MATTELMFISSNAPTVPEPTDCHLLIAQCKNSWTRGVALHVTLHSFLDDLCTKSSSIRQTKPVFGQPTTFHKYYAITWKLKVYRPSLLSQPLLERHWLFKSNHHFKVQTHHRINSLDRMLPCDFDSTMGGNAFVAQIILTDTTVWGSLDAVRASAIFGLIDFIIPDGQVLQDPVEKSSGRLVSVVMIVV